MRWFVRLWLSLLLVSCAASAHAATTVRTPSSAAAPMELRVAVPSDERAAYFIRLLEQSLQLIGQPYTVRYLKDLPPRRMWAMLGRGDINLFYGMITEEKERNRRIVPVRVGLTNGLIGQRVLLIRPEDAGVFAKVRSVSDLKRTGLVAGFGEGWADVKIWRGAGLPVYEHVAPWPTIFAMAAAGNRHVDYLPRGVIEVLEEARTHPEMVVEQRLLFEYPADFGFYLSAAAGRYQPILERALQEAEATGLKERLLREAFGDDIKALGLTRRLRLPLPGAPR